MPRPVPCLLLSLLVACGGRDEEHLSALLISLDTTNRWALSCYGEVEGITPNLDRLASESVVYEAARTTAPITAPAHASMLTGLYPLRHSVRMNGTMVLPESASTLAERAERAGYRTGAFIAAVVLNAEFGFDQGFETFDQPLESLAADPEAPRERTADVISHGALAWIRELEPDQPFFLWLHFFDPHGPYGPPPRFRERAGGDAYLGEVAYADHHIGRVLDTLRERGLMDRLAVVVVGDHGEALDRHGEKTHGTLGYDSTLAVPLIVRDPSGWGAGTRVDVPTSVVDVFPTLIDAMGLGGPGDVDGRSLFRREAEANRGVYFETYMGYISFGWSQLAGWADEDGKLVHTSEPVYFDLDSDPGELEARAANTENAGSYRDAIARLAAKSRLEQAGLASSQDDLLSEIEKLGYAGITSEAADLPEPLAEVDRPSPLERIEAMRFFVRAGSDAQRGRHRRAVELFQSAVELDPTNHTARYDFAISLMQLGNFREAIGQLRSALELRGDWIGARLNLALCYENLDLPESALEHYALALAGGGAPPEAVERYLALLERLGRNEEAAELRAGLER